MGIESPRSKLKKLLMTKRKEPKIKKSTKRAERAQRLMRWL